jgi:hypothetical protein
MRVIAEASTQMRINVEGFPPTDIADNQGKRVVYTQRVLKTGDPPLDSVSISIDGLPVPGPGRWYAILIAAALAAVGLLVARDLMQIDDNNNPAYDRQQARELLLKELVDVERAQQAGDLGPRAYSEAKKTLLDALARLGEDVLAPPQRKKRRRAPA